MIEKALISAVIIMAAIMLMLAASLVKAMVDVRIWKKTAYEYEGQLDSMKEDVSNMSKELENTKYELDWAKRENEDNVEKLVDACNDIEEYRSDLRAAKMRIAELEPRTIEKVFDGWTRIADNSGVRDFYIEKDGIRIIVEDGKATSGWYAKKFIKEGDVAEPCKGTCENAAPLTNYHYIKSMTALEMAEFFENIDEKFAKTCEYCSLNNSDGMCAPAPEGEDKKAYCKGATLKWLMAARISEEAISEDVEDASIEN